MVKKSAGLLMYRRRQGVVEFFLVHPGGPFWAKKDAGSWSIPKGEYPPGEDPIEVAKREFEEETGFKAAGEFIPLTPRKQPGGKIITAWAFEGDCNSSAPVVYCLSCFSSWHGWTGLFHCDCFAISGLCPVPGSALSFW